MVYKEEALNKLISLVTEISKDPKNRKFRDNVLKAITDSAPSNSFILDEIHEYCIQSNLKIHAESFYKDFRLLNIKGRLVNDFVRMEQFKRQNNFEDFCLSIHQQLEAVVNTLCKNDPQFCNYIILNRNTYTHKVKNREYFLWQLLMSNYKSQSDADKLFGMELYRWDYAYKIKAVLYYYFFDKKIYNFFDFKKAYDTVNDIYQSRNMNHRESFQNQSQQEIINRVLASKDRYYFRFLGFLEEFTSNINSNV